MSETLLVSGAAHGVEPGLSERARIQELEEELRGAEARAKAMDAELVARGERIQELEARLENAELEARKRRIDELGAEWAAQQAQESARDEEDVAEKTREAIDVVTTAGCGISRTSASLALVRLDSAAGLLVSLAETARTCEAEAKPKVKTAERAVRDVFVVRCRAACKPGDREAFLAVAEKAFPQGDWDLEIRSQILMAVSKIARTKPDTFLSNNQLATASRGRSRKRRARRPRDSSAATLSPAARKSSVPARRTASVSDFDSWKREPQYVTLGVNRLQLAIRAGHQGTTPS